jgi:hypothetical protein
MMFFVDYLQRLSTISIRCSQRVAGLFARHKADGYSGRMPHLQILIDCAQVAVQKPLTRVLADGIAI